MGLEDFITVSAVGQSSGSFGLRFNDGANFGPDTSGTSTNGIQEALNSISTNGGTVFVRKGSYSLSSPLYNTGNFQTVIFEAGCVLVFSNSGSYSNWNSDVADIWVACNFASASGSQATYHDIAWIGNGTTITCSGILTGTGEQVFGLFAYVTALSLTGNYKILIDGFTANGYGGVLVNITANSGSGLTYGQQWRRVIIRNLDGTMASNSKSATYGAGLYISGCNGLEVSDTVIDTTASGGSASTSNCFVTSSRGGDTQSIVFRRCKFISLGATTGTPGSCLKVEGSTASTGSTHDILWEDCLFLTTLSTSPIGGLGGATLDDGGGTTTGRIYNLEFRGCQWANGSNTAGITLTSTGSSTGFLLFNGGSTPGTISGSLQGRPLSVGPINPAVYASALRTALPLASSTLVSYTPTNPGQYRVTLYVASKAADTPTITVSWTDPDNLTAETSTPISVGMAANSFVSAIISVVAINAVAIVVKGKATTSATALYASVTVDQVQ